MKTTFTAIFLLLLSLAHADERSAALLSKVKTKINSSPAYSVEFTTNGFSGTLTVSGNRYSLIADDMEVYYDGQTLWNYNKRDREVNVESLSEKESTVMTNPSKLLAVSDADFTHRLTDETTVELTPRSDKAPYTKIIIIINPQSQLPERAVISDRASGEQIKITISKYTPNVFTGVDAFKFDPKKHKDVDVIDFRNK